jgi:hypothetical protein
MKQNNNKLEQFQRTYCGQEEIPGHPSTSSGLWPGMTCGEWCEKYGTGRKICNCKMKGKQKFLL